VSLCSNPTYTILIIAVFLTILVLRLTFEILFLCFYLLTGGLLWKVVQELQKVPQSIWGTAMVLYAAGMVTLFWFYRSYVVIVSACFYFLAYLCLQTCTNFTRFMKNQTKQLERKLELGVFAEKVVQAAA
jgi:hypothetical protein